MLSKLLKYIMRARYYSLGAFDVKLSFNARCTWNSLNLYRHTGAWHLVWYKVSIHVENATLPNYTVCAECNSPDCREVQYGDEGLTVCGDCQSVEQGYRYLNKREFEALS